MIRLINAFINWLIFMFFFYYIFLPFIYGRSEAKAKRTIKRFVYGYLHVIRFFYFYHLLFDNWKITLVVVFIIFLILKFCDRRTNKLKLFLGLFFLVVIPLYLYFGFCYYLMYVIWDLPQCYNTFIVKKKRIMMRNWYSDVLKYFAYKRKIKRKRRRSYRLGQSLFLVVRRWARLMLKDKRIPKRVYYISKLRLSRLLKRQAQGKIFKRKRGQGRFKSWVVKLIRRYRKRYKSGWYNVGKTMLFLVKKSRRRPVIRRKRGISFVIKYLMMVQIRGVIRKRKMSKNPKTYRSRPHILLSRFGFKIKKRRRK